MKLPNRQIILNAALAALLFFTPLVFMVWWGDGGLPPKQFLNIAPTKAVFVSCYLMLGIWLAYTFFKDDTWYFILVSLGLVYVGFQFAHFTPPLYSFVYDFPHHLDTILHYTKSLSRQALNGWANEANQPPLYYMLAGQWLNITDGLGYRNWRSLHYFSFLQFMVFAVFSARLIAWCVKCKSLRYVATLLFFLWPVHLVHCCRVSNDLLVHMCIMIFMVWWLTWLGSRKSYYFTYAVLVACVAFLVKANAILIVVFAGLTMVIYYLKKISITDYVQALPNRKLLLVLAISFAACASYNTLHMAYQKYTKPHKVSLFVGERHAPMNPSRNAEVPPLSYYLSFQIRDFLKGSKVNVYKDFLTAHLKSSLYATIHKFKPSSLNLYINGLFLFLLVWFLILYTWLAIWRPGTIFMPHICVIFYLIALALLILIQLIDPTRWWSNIRHIYVVVPITVVFFASMSEAVSYKHKIIHYFHLSLLWLFALVLMAFGFQQFYLI